jgi:hypothetical protein
MPRPAAMKSPTLLDVTSTGDKEDGPGKVTAGDGEAETNGERDRTDELVQSSPVCCAKLGLKTREKTKRNATVWSFRPRVAIPNTIERAWARGVRKAHRAQILLSRYICALAQRRSRRPIIDLA